MRLETHIKTTFGCFEEILLMEIHEIIISAYLRILDGMRGDLGASLPRKPSLAPDYQVSSENLIAA